MNFDELEALPTPVKLNPRALSCADFERAGLWDRKACCAICHQDLLQGKEGITLYTTQGAEGEGELELEVCCNFSPRTREGTGLIQTLETVNELAAGA